MKMIKERFGVFFFLSTALIFLLAVLVGVTSQSSYTFFSKADTSQPQMVISTVSRDVVSVDASRLPSCVKSVSYLPADTLNMSCFAQITCISIHNEQDVVAQGCSYDSEIVSCDVTDTCIHELEWMKKAAVICGCP